MTKFKINKPIFIVGVPRSGTTLLYDLMAFHPDLAFFSQLDLKEMLSEKFMEFEYLRRRIFEIRRWLFSRDGFEVRITTSFEMPHEFGLFWNKWIEKSWARAYDVNESSRKGLRAGVIKVLEKKKKKRFLSKDPTHSIRIEYLNEVFPGAIFVNIIRDALPVGASMIRVIYKNPNGYFGLSLKNNNQMDFDLFERHARQWIEVNNEIQEVFLLGLDKNQHYDVKYEDLVSNPRQTINDIFKFCQLDDYDIFDKGFRRISDQGEIQLISTNLFTANKKYKEELTELEIKKIKDILRNH